MAILHTCQHLTGTQFTPAHCRANPAAPTPPLRDAPVASISHVPTEGGEPDIVTADSPNRGVQLSIENKSLAVLQLQILNRRISPNFSIFPRIHLRVSASPWSINKLHRRNSLFLVENHRISAAVRTAITNGGRSIFPCRTMHTFTCRRRNSTIRRISTFPTRISIRMYTLQVKCWGRYSAKTRPIPPPGEKIPKKAPLDT